MRRLKIEGTLISDDTECWVIAEIGHNHQGDIKKAKDMFHRARECGVSAVKLQKRDNKALYTKELYNKPYENENSFGNTYGEHREFLEFGKPQYEELQSYAKELGVTMFATAFDFGSADFLAEIGVPCYKIASGDLRNTPLLKHVAKLGKPMIISTGGGTLNDVRRAYEAVRPFNSEICFMQCTAAYPTEPEEMNLRVITVLREEFPDVVIGLSDHYNGIAMAVVAYMLGARIIEKHFTLNHTWKGTDHPLSLEPIGMHKMIRDLKRAKIALGDGVKRLFPSEEAPLSKMAKKLVAAREIPSGAVISESDIAIKSPGGGLDPFEIDKVIGKTLKRALAEDEDFRFEDLA